MKLASPPLPHEWRLSSKAHRSFKMLGEGSETDKYLVNENAAREWAVSRSGWRSSAVHGGYRKRTGTVFVVLTTALTAVQVQAMPMSDVSVGRTDPQADSGGTTSRVILEAHLTRAAIMDTRHVRGRALLYQCPVLGRVGYRDRSGFTVENSPVRLSSLNVDPWEDFGAAVAVLPSSIGRSKTR